MSAVSLMVINSNETVLIDLKSQIAPCKYLRGASFDVIESVAMKRNARRAAVVAEPDFDDIEAAGGRGGMMRNVGVGQTANLALFGGRDGFLWGAESVGRARLDFDETQNLAARTILPRDAVDFAAHSAALAALIRQSRTPVALDNAIAARF